MSGIKDLATRHVEGKFDGNNFMPDPSVPLQDVILDFWLTHWYNVRVGGVIYSPDKWADYMGLTSKYDGFINERKNIPYLKCDNHGMGRNSTYLSLLGSQFPEEFERWILLTRLGVL